MIYLKQSTAAQSVLLGPFVDDTDGVTAETGLTINASDIRLSANGGNMAAKNSGGGTHDENGWYTITLDATDTATVGRLQISAAVSGALPVFMECHVLEEAVYDALFAASADLEMALADGAITAAKIGADAITGAKIAAGAIAKGDQLTGLNDLSAAEVNAEVDTALGDYDAPTKAEMDAAFTQIKGATWSSSTDTLEALRDRGDAAWITANGFSTHSAADVWTSGTRSLTDKAGFGLADGAITAAKIASDAITSAKIADGALTAAKFAAALCNKIADHVRRRSQANVEASSDGDALSLQSEYGLIQQAQEASVSGSTMTVNQTDGATSLGTRTVASDENADPITGVS